MTDEPKYNDYPFDKIAAKGQQLIRMGLIVHYKWTCERCGSRQTFAKANTLYHEGTCEACGHTTSLKERGGNMLVIGGRGAALMSQGIVDTPPPDGVA